MYGAVLWTTDDVLLLPALSCAPCAGFRLHYSCLRAGLGCSGASQLHSHHSHHHQLLLLLQLITCMYRCWWLCAQDCPSANLTQAQRSAVRALYTSRQGKPAKRVVELRAALALDLTATPGD